MTSHLGERLCPLVDGQLCHDERDRALAHLAHCAGCREEVAEYRRMKQRLSGLWAPALPEGLADRLVGLGGTRQPPLVPTGAAGARGATAHRPGPVRPGGAGRRRAAHSRLPLAVPTSLAALGPSPRGRLAAPPGRVDLTGAAVDLSRPRSPRAGGITRIRRLDQGRPGRGQARVRRTLVGSAALMLLTVTGAAVGDQPTAARGSTIRPSAPSTQLPVVNRGGTTPLVSSVSFTPRG
ncbi:anti-sigma factor family protein [Pseudofrankia asymbiotica]|uniref:Zinc-finger domain-containing protein n=1 Tax=Pseudofrankia asymbiotica TaxID=1834516 RepID=A0A1V2IKR6_9ACTN|nr:zf-HC2 domain-containing protein [Pseudofrankia asymbiotica]ONH33579.1 hypothetical protein BL253_00635 [Pseudofrankia asymbiotica]